MLTNYQPELELYFDIGKDLVIFEDIQELEQKASYYLEHDEERSQIAKNGYRKVKECHSYQQRIQEMVSLMSIKGG